MNIDRRKKTELTLRYVMDLERMKQNLIDAGCDEITSKDIIRMYRNGMISDALLKMKKDRCRLMDELHENGRKVDCLDFLIRQTEKALQARH